MNHMRVNVMNARRCEPHHAHPQRAERLRALADGSLPPSLVAATRQGERCAVRQHVDLIEEGAERVSEVADVIGRVHTPVADDGQAQIDSPGQVRGEPAVGYVHTRFELSLAPAVDRLLIAQQGVQELAAPSRTERPVGQVQWTSPHYQ